MKLFENETLAEAIPIDEDHSKLTKIANEKGLLFIMKGIELQKQMEEDSGKISDGYHTFDELYHHRAILFSVICNNYPELAWKSKLHHNPETDPMYDGMFIVGINTPTGQATYHYHIDPYWDIFNVKELETAPEWDGHTPDEAIERIGTLREIPVSITNKE